MTWKKVINCCHLIYVRSQMLSQQNLMLRTSSRCYFTGRDTLCSQWINATALYLWTKSSVFRAPVNSVQELHFKVHTSETRKRYRNCLLWWRGRCGVCLVIFSHPCSKQHDIVYEDVTHLHILLAFVFTSELTFKSAAKGLLFTMNSTSFHKEQRRRTGHTNKKII